MHPLRVVLVRTKFPENIGMAARACANMGADELVLVSPCWWDVEKARPLATPKGEPVLARVRVCASLSEALADTVLSIGTTARVGGWRRGLLTPVQSAEECAAALPHGPVALVFGSEDRGLDNGEIEQCSRLANIPTDGASSLNLAQAVLLMLYECMKLRQGARPVLDDPGQGSRRITHAEQEILMDTLRKTLLTLDYLKGNNPDYFMMPLRRFFGKTPLRRHEMDMLMGVCRQVNGLAARAGLGKKGGGEDGGK